MIPLLVTAGDLPAARGGSFPGPGALEGNPDAGLSSAQPSFDSMVFEALGGPPMERVGGAPIASTSGAPVAQLPLAEPVPTAGIVPVADDILPPWTGIADATGTPLNAPRPPDRGPVSRPPSVRALTVPVVSDGGIRADGDQKSSRIASLPADLPSVEPSDPELSTDPIDRTDPTADESSRAMGADVTLALLTGWMPPVPSPVPEEPVAGEDVAARPPVDPGVQEGGVSMRSPRDPASDGPGLVDSGRHARPDALRASDPQEGRQRRVAEAATIPPIARSIPLAVDASQTAESLPRPAFGNRFPADGPRTSPGILSGGRIGGVSMARQAMPQNLVDVPPVGIPPVGDPVALGNGPGIIPDGPSSQESDEPLPIGDRAIQIPPIPMAATQRPQGLPPGNGQTGVGRGMPPGSGLRTDGGPDSTTDGRASVEPMFKADPEVSFVPAAVDRGTYHGPIVPTDSNPKAKTDPDPGATEAAPSLRPFRAPQPASASPETAAIGQGRGLPPQRMTPVSSVAEEPSEASRLVGRPSGPTTSSSAPVSVPTLAPVPPRDPARADGRTPSSSEAFAFARGSDLPPVGDRNVRQEGGQGDRAERQGEPPGSGRRVAGSSEPTVQVFPAAAGKLPAASTQDTGSLLASDPATAVDAALVADQAAGAPASFKVPVSSRPVFEAPVKTAPEARVPTLNGNSVAPNLEGFGIQPTPEAGSESSPVIRVTTAPMRGVRPPGSMDSGESTMALRLEGRFSDGFDEYVSRMAIPEVGPRPAPLRSPRNSAIAGGTQIPGQPQTSGNLQIPRVSEAIGGGLARLIEVHGATDEGIPRASEAGMDRSMTRTVEAPSPAVLTSGDYLRRVWAADSGLPSTSAVATGMTPVLNDSSREVRQGNTGHAGAPELPPVDAANIASGAPAMATQRLGPEPVTPQAARGSFLDQTLEKRGFSADSTPARREGSSGPDRAIESAGTTSATRRPAMETHLATTSTPDAVPPRTDSAGLPPESGTAVAATGSTGSALILQPPNQPAVESKGFPLTVEAAASRPGARLQELLSGEVVLLHRLQTASMTAVLRPEPGSELRVELRRRQGAIEIRATVERGDSRALSEGWPELQQQMRAQGIHLHSLERDPASEASRNGPGLADDRSSQTGGRGRNQQPAKDADGWPRGRSETTAMSDPVPSRPSGPSTAQRQQRRLLESWA